MAFYEHTSTTLKFWELILIKFIDAKMIWLTISVHFGISNEVLTVSVLRVRLILRGSGGAQGLGDGLCFVRRQSKYHMAYRVRIWLLCVSKGVNTTIGLL
jgi:hypothetical protein